LAAVISPYVRRLRLAREIRTVRTARGLTHDQLAARVGVSRQAVSRLENGHVVDQDDILKMLDALEVEDEVWTRIVTIAREAGERGWWESNKEMGARQALYADLEAGAATIREFHTSFLPGLLQTPEFTRVRVEADGRGDRGGQVADKAVEARNGRQRMLRRPGGPSYDTVIDELAVRRRAAPVEIVRAQLYHVAARVNADPRTSVRVLPVGAAIEGYSLPRTAFSIYTFPDADDPTVVAVDTATDDVILTGDQDAKRYEDLYRRLGAAALSVADSLRFLIDVATNDLGPR
jgi:transcriptional regulator with XRE-family HTH domain